MTGSNDIAAAPRPNMRRWWATAIALLLLFTGFVRLHEFFSHKFYSNTGKAQWIWFDHPLASEQPVAFFAVRDFQLPERRDYVKLKVAGDPEYTLYMNGIEVGGTRDAEKSLLDVYDVTAIARTGHNRIVAALRSANGVGGFLLSADISRSRENLLVSGAEWKVFSEWSSDLIVRDSRSEKPVPPLVIGAPPVGRWNYLRSVPKELTPIVHSILYPIGSIAFATALPGIVTVSGVTVAISKPAAATAYDFGPVRGRARLEVRRPGLRVVRIRYANAEAELKEPGELVPLVLGRGETVVTDPDVRSFRFVVVYGEQVDATVVKPGE